MTPADIEFYTSLFKDLSLDEISAIYQLAETRELKAGDIYIPKGALSHKVALIRKGLIRTFHEKENGEDITVMIRWEQQMVASVDGIYYDRPSRFTYQALEDTLLMQVDYKAIQDIIDNNPHLSAARNNFLLLMLGQAMERIESFVLLSPEERYLQWVREKPGINNRIANKHISTFLGITPVSLSRIRKRISRSAANPPQ